MRFATTPSESAADVSGDEAVLLPSAFFMSRRAAEQSREERNLRHRSKWREKRRFDVIWSAWLKMCARIGLTEEQQELVAVALS